MRTYHLRSNLANQLKKKNGDIVDTAPMKPDLTPNTQVISEGCTHAGPLLLRAQIHNLKNSDKPDRIFHNLFRKLPNTHKEHMKKSIYGGRDRDIDCPSANVDNMWLNYTPGPEGFDAYLRGYYKR